MNHTGYLAPVGFEEQLEQELENIISRHGRLFIAEGAPQKVHWVQQIWFDPQKISFHSISEAARHLRALSKNWAYYPHQCIRRGVLISAQLPYFSPKPIVFPSDCPTMPLGSWTLLDVHTLLASPRCSSPFPHGEILFQESKVPPSRAYLKLWELFTRIGHFPQMNEHCLEIGASPGSWTWVLSQLGAHIIAVDRAPLAPSLSSYSKLTFLQKDAFSVEPDSTIDWVFSDVVCFPEKLLQWVKRWLDTKNNCNFVCTLKFQGKTGYEVIKEFEKIEGSQILHLFHNKHELTWVRSLVHN